MPGAAHETFVALLRERPTLLNDILRALDRPPVTAGLTAKDSALRLTNPLEVRPDVVLLDDAPRGPWIVVDVQRAEDAAKQHRWPAAAGVLLDTRGVMGDVIIITHDAAVARWAATVARVMGPGGTELWLRPIVIQLTLAEVETLLAQGRADLAVVATWAVHDQTGKRAKAVLHAAVAALHAEPDPMLRAELLRAMISVLGDALAAELKELLMLPSRSPRVPSTEKSSTPSKPAARPVRSAASSRGAASPSTTSPATASSLAKTSRSSISSSTAQ